MKKTSFKLNAKNKVLRQRLKGDGILLSIFTECQKSENPRLREGSFVSLYLANKDCGMPTKFKGQAIEARQDLL